MRITPPLMIILVLVTGLLVSCSATPQAPPSSSASSSQAAPDDLPPSPPAISPPGGSAQSRTFIMTAKQFEFNPSTITVKKGDHVVLKVKSLDVTHGFSIPAFNVNVPLPKDEEKVVEFDASKSGTFPFACSIACGSGHARMKGAIIVEE